MSSIIPVTTLTALQEAEANPEEQQEQLRRQQEIPTAALKEARPEQPNEDQGPAQLSKEAQARIEVALYASGRPLSLDEISRASRITSKRRLAQLMIDLSKKVNSTFGAIELKQIDGPMYSLQLKPEYNSIAKKFASKPLLSGSTLRTLSYVVYLQPVSASELVQRRGSQVYSHLKDLLEVGFVHAERKGRGRVFRTTDIFADYFGLSHDPEQQRKQVAKQGLVSKAQTAEQKRQEEALAQNQTERVGSTPASSSQ